MNAETARRAAQVEGAEGATRDDDAAACSSIRADSKIDKEREIEIESKPVIVEEFFGLQCLN